MNIKLPKLPIKRIPPQVIVVITWARKSLYFIFVILVLLIYSLMVLRISSLSNAEPSDASVQEKLAGAKSTKIDQALIDKLQLLQDQNIQVQTLFKQARDNPFQE